MNTIGGTFFYVLLRILLFFDGLEDFTMKINWIARIKNKSFWVTLIPAMLLLIQTIAAVYLQAIGKPVKSAVLSLARQIIFFVPAALILPTFLGVEGVLWTGPVADGLAFLLSLALLMYERHHLKKGHARQLSAGQCETA